MDDLKEGQPRMMMPDLNKPETWFIGVVHIDPEKGAVLSFLKSDRPLEPDYPGVPRTEILESWRDDKRALKSLISIIHQESKKNFLPVNLLPPSLREVHRVLSLLAEHETSEDMKLFWVQVRDLLCLFFFEDLPYRGRAQWCIEQADVSKLLPSKDERYWFRLEANFKHE